MATREREPLVNVTLVVVQKNSKLHMRFDLSPFTEIGKLKNELESVFKIPADRQQWLTHGVSHIENHRCLNDYNIGEAGVIELHLQDP